MRSLPVISCVERACGACCMGMGTLPADWYRCATPHPRSTMGHLESLPVELQGELLAVETPMADPGVDVFGYLRRALGVDNVPCMWLDLETRRCKHYEYRPEVCQKAVVAGDEKCRRDRKRYGIDPNPRRVLRNGRIVVVE